MLLPLVVGGAAAVAAMNACNADPECSLGCGASIAAAVVMLALAIVGALP